MLRIFSHRCHCLIDFHSKSHAHIAVACGQSNVLKDRSLAGTKGRRLPGRTDASYGSSHSGRMPAVLTRFNISKYLKRSILIHFWVDAFEPERKPKTKKCIAANSDHFLKHPQKSMGWLDPASAHISSATSVAMRTCHAYHWYYTRKYHITFSSSFSIRNKNLGWKEQWMENLRGSL